MVGALLAAEPVKVEILRDWVDYVGLSVAAIASVASAIAAFYAYKTVVAANEDRKQEREDAHVAEEKETGSGGTRRQRQDRLGVYKQGQGHDPGGSHHAQRRALRHLGRRSLCGV